MHLLLRQVEPAEVRCGYRSVHQSEFALAGRDHERHVRSPLRVDHAHGNLRMLAMKAPQHAGERIDRKGCLRNDVEPATTEPEDFTDQGTGRGQIPQDLLRRLDQRLTRRGECDAVWEAVKQASAEFTLQSPDRMGQRGLCNMERNGRGCESAVLDHDDEMFQLASFHRISVNSR
ncbi:hypothetical protein GCM10023080_031040 [Streptomyces pseudoechinosporeus]